MATINVGIPTLMATEAVQPPGSRTHCLEIVREHVAVGHEIPPEEEALERAAQALSLAAALLHRLPRAGWFGMMLLE